MSDGDEKRREEEPAAGEAPDARERPASGGAARAGEEGRPGAVEPLGGAATAGTETAEERRPEPIPGGAARTGQDGRPEVVEPSGGQGIPGADEAEGPRPEPVPGGAASTGEAAGGDESSARPAVAAGDDPRPAAPSRPGDEPPSGQPLPGPRRSWQDVETTPVPRPRAPAAEAASQGWERHGAGHDETGGADAERSGAPLSRRTEEAGGEPLPPARTPASPAADEGPAARTPHDRFAGGAGAVGGGEEVIAPARAAGSAESREGAARAAAARSGGEAAAPAPAAGNAASREGAASAGAAAGAEEIVAPERETGGVESGEPATAPAAEVEPDRRAQPTPSDATLAWPRPQRFEGASPSPSPPPARWGSGGRIPADEPAAGAASSPPTPLPSPRPRSTGGEAAEPPPPSPPLSAPAPPPSAPPPPPLAERPTAAPEAASSPPPATEPPPPPLDDAFFADLASGARERDAEATERSYRELVRQVDSYREQGYDFYGLVGYPAAGKTHALKALAQRLHGFDASAREHFRRERAPVPTEAWPFYYAHTGSHGERWVFMDPGGELYYRLRSNDWRLAEASAGLLHTIGCCRGLFLLLHLTRGHLGLGATGFARGMDEEERQREAEAQKAQEEIEFFDHFLLFARALAAERGDVAKLVRRAADAGLDEALRPYHRSPKLAAPVAVLFTQADRLAGGMDFAGVEGSYAAPQSAHFRTAPFVARNLPTLLTTLLRHARRFRFDFAQSYVERPTVAGEGLPLWAVRNEPLSVGLVPALEYLLRRGPAGGGRDPGRLAIDSRTALRLHRRLHPRLWDGIEVEL